MADTLSACGCTAPLSAAHCVLDVAAFNGTASTGAIPLGATWLFPAPLRNVTTMVDPELAITEVVEIPGEPGAFDVTLTAARLPVAVVWIESLLCCGHFSDNAFLLTENVRTLRYTPSPDSRGWAHTPAPGTELNVTAGQFAASLSVWSLYDTAGYASESCQR